MADITLISGSTLGGAEYVAEHLAEKLEDAGFSTETLHGPQVEELSSSGIWLVISSTHGAGDIPDNLLPFYNDLQSQKPDLSQVRFGAIGIGSREYDTFCGAIDKLQKLGLTGSYPKNNRCSVFELCITLHFDPSLYGPGSPIIHS